MSVSNEEKKQELYTELKALDDEIKKLNSHLENLDEQISDLNSSKIVVNKFSELKKGDDLRVPLTSGIYAKASLSNSKKLMINVGAGVTVEKSVDEITKILDSQITELVSYRENVVAQMKVLIVRIEEIQKEFE